MLRAKLNLLLSKKWDDIEKYHHSKKWGAKENKICRYNTAKKCAEPEKI